MVFSPLNTLTMLRNQIVKSLTAAAIVLFAGMATCASAASSDQRVEIALGQGEDNGFRDRLQAVQSLYKGLSETDAELLYQGIIAPTQPQGLPHDQWAALYNDAFNAFGMLQNPLKNYPERLLKLIAQDSRPTVLRDYALQHLLSHMESKLGAEDRKKLIQKLQPLVNSAPATTLPGTYLLGIWQLADKPGYPTAEAISKSALDIAAATDAFIPNRISAIQICGQLGYKPALELSKTIAKDATLPVALRSASLATIGELADKSLIPFLRKIKHTGTPDRRILFVTDAAIKKLQ